MFSKYVSSIILAIRESKNNIIMVFQSKLNEDEINFISDLAIDYNKIVLFASMQAILFNDENDKLLIVRE